MQVRASLLGIIMMMGAVNAVSQTTVTTPGGTTNTVPVFTGTSTVSNSPITVSGSNVGIGITAPGFPLTVSGAASATSYCISGSNCITAWPTGLGALSLTTNGTSGPATFSGNILNIPQYSGGVPASPANSYQFNNGGSLGGVSQWLYDPTTGVACNQLAISACDGVASMLPSPYLPYASKLIYNTGYGYGPLFVSDNSGGGGANPVIVFAALGGTFASPAAASGDNGDSLGELLFLGYDGSELVFSGLFSAIPDQGVASGFVPSYLQETGFTGHQILENWNNSSETFNGIDLEITNNASASNSSAIYVHNVSTDTDIFSVQPNGNGGVAGTFTATGFPARSSGSTANCWNTAGTASVCGGNSVSLTTSGNSGAATLSGTTLNIPEYQGVLSLTTVGTSGAATLSGTTLNIPQYGGQSYTFSTGLKSTSGTITNNLSTGISGGQTVYGGTGVTDMLILQGTTANGTLTSPSVKVAVGNAGATTALAVLNNGNVGIGTTAPTVPLVITEPSPFNTAASIQYTQSGQAIAKSFVLNKPPLLQVVGGEADNNGFAEIGLIQPGVQNGSAPWLAFASTRATTTQVNSSTYSALQSNDMLGTISFGGDDGVNMRAVSAQIRSYATAAWSGTSYPSNIQFLTTPPADTTPVIRMIIADGGNIGIGTATPAAKLEVNGSVKLTSGSGASLTFADGTTQTTAWTGVLCGGDYAEAMVPKGSKLDYHPGDVLVLTRGRSDDVQRSSEPYSTLVAGVIATKPGVIGKREAMIGRADSVTMAMVGVVPTKVTTKNGAIHKGDLLVTSSTPGYAMRGTDRSRMLGAVIGKAMEDLQSGDGVIEVLVTLQ